MKDKTRPKAQSRYKEGIEPDWQMVNIADAKPWHLQTIFKGAGGAFRSSTGQTQQTTAEDSALDLQRTGGKHPLASERWVRGKKPAGQAKRGNTRPAQTIIQGGQP